MDLLRSQVAASTPARRPRSTVKRDNITTLETAINLLNIAGLVLGLLAGLAGVALFTSGISRRVVAAAANADRLGEGLPLEPVAPRLTNSAAWPSHSCGPKSCSPAGLRS